MRGMNLVTRFGFILKITKLEIWSELDFFDKKYERGEEGFGWYRSLSADVGDCLTADVGDAWLSWELFLKQEAERENYR